MKRTSFERFRCLLLGRENQPALATIHIVAATASILCAPSFALGQDLSSGWKGTRVTIHVGTSAGGGYDAYARMFARYLGKHLPGSPTVIVNNMPGAGSNVMSSYVAVVAPKDGTAIGAPFSTQPLIPILEDAGKLQYDPSKLNYIGSATEDTFLCITRKGAAAKTFADAFKTEVVMGGTAETGSTGYLPIMLNNVLGTKFKVVFGYPGSREITLAMDRGEIDGQCGKSWSNMLGQYADMMTNDQVNLFVQESVRGHPDMTKLGVPRTVDFAKTDEQRRILEIIYSQGAFQRPYFVAAEVPKERVEALRTAFMATWTDPELLAEAKRINLEVAPISGRDLQAELARIYNNPPDLLQRTREAIKLKR
jgi:tripartite-type tricarboxylate transporter receptor subunit TctC